MNKFKLSTLCIISSILLFFASCDSCKKKVIKHEFPNLSDTLRSDVTDSTILKICNLPLRPVILNGKKFYILDHPSLVDGQIVYYSSFENLKIPSLSVINKSNKIENSSEQTIDFALIQEFDTENLPCSRTRRHACIPYLSEPLLDQLRVEDNGKIYQIVLVSHHEPSHYEAIEAFEFDNDATYNSFRESIKHDLPACKNFSIREGASFVDTLVQGSTIRVYKSTDIDVF
jgi:hypothetical protein